MEGRVSPEGMSVEQFDDARRIFEVSQEAVRPEMWRMACLMASKENGAILGEGEFVLRKGVHRIGAVMLANAANERGKKGGYPWDRERRLTKRALTPAAPQVSTRQAALPGSAGRAGWSIRAGGLPVENRLDFPARDRAARRREGGLRRSSATIAMDIEIFC